VAVGSTESGAELKAPGEETLADPTIGPTRRRRRRRRLLVLTVALLAVGLVALVGLTSGQGAQAPPGATRAGAAAPFVLDNLERGGPRVSLAEYRGRPLVLNFFASWCVPCRKEMPGFERVHRRLGAEVAFLGINNQDQQEPALQLLRETGVSYPAGYDPAGKVALNYGLFGMPTTIFISPQGQVLKRRTGEISESELEATIRQLLLS
jgi:cytochrome c biogenesis protein CcmG/thiol:disulfide interchange protein DsbE